MKTAGKKEATLITASVRIRIPFIVSVLFFFVSLQAYSQHSGRIEIYFRNDNFSLQPRSQKLLDSIAVKLKAGVACYVKVEGHTDSKGTAKANDILSKNRAETVAGFFEEKGIPKDSIVSEWWGMRKRKYRMESDSLNRRAEISYIIYNKLGTVVQKKEPEKKKETTPSEKRDSIAISKMKNVGVGETFAMNSVQFYGGTPTLLPGAFPVLDGLAEQLINNPTLEISIEGHICCYPTDEDNLSEKRAKTVYDYLVAKSIDPSRLTYKGFGHTRPLTEERTAEEQQQNRRVEIRITKK